MDKRTNVLTGIASGETSTVFKMDSVDVLVSFGGTFGGGTITLEMNEQGSWEPITDGAFTSAGQKLLQLAQGIEIRAVTTSGTAMSVNLSISPRY